MSTSAVMGFIVGGFLGALLDPIKLVYCVFLSAIIPNFMVSTLLACLISLAIYFFIAIIPVPIIALIQIAATIVLVIFSRKIIKILKRVRNK